MNPIKTKTGWNLLLTAVLLAADLVLLNALLGRARVGRIDLTEGRHYSLSDVTKRLMSDLEEPGEITFYYSSPETQHELLRPLIDPLKDLLAEFGAASDGRIQVHFSILDKEGKDAQDAAMNAYGIRAMPIPVHGAFETAIRKTYFSLVVASGSSFEHFGLEQLIKVSAPAGAVEIEVELADIESLVAKALRKVARGFGSVPGALAAKDKRAKATYYVTPDLLPEHLKGLKDTVVKVAERFNKESGGRFELNVVDPYEGVKPEERNDVDVQNARKLGVRPIPVNPMNLDERFHSWLRITVDGQTDSAPLFRSSSIGEADVRAEIEASLKHVIPGYMPVLGIAAPEPPINPMMMTQGRTPRSEFGFLSSPEALGKDYEIRTVDLDASGGEIPPNVGVLVLIRPGELADKALFQIDQFVMRGGRLVVCADSFALDAQMAQQREVNAAKIDNKKIADLLAHWGAKVEPQLVLDTRCEYFERERPRYIGGQRVTEYERIQIPYFTRFGDEGLDRSHPITRGATVDGFFWATPVELGTLPEGVKGTVIASSSKESSTVDSVALAEADYRPPENARTHGLAVVLEGRFKSYFADKPIPGLDKPADPKKEKTGEEPKPADGAAHAAAEFRGAPLRECERPTTIVVIGDSDFISPTVMMSFFRSGDERLYSSIMFLANAIDYGGPDTEMLEVRARPPTRRPLTGLANLPPEEKAAKASRTMWLTAAISVAALLGVAVAWTIVRGARKPLALPPPETHSGGQS